MFSLSQSILAVALLAGANAQVITSDTPCDGYTCATSGKYWCGERLEIKTSDELAETKDICYVQGHLAIAACKGCDVVDMPALEAIGGNFTLVGTEVTDIQGFAKLASIGGDFHYLVHSSLTHTSGFNAVKHIGGNFYFGINKKLEKVDGFNHPEGINVGGHIYVASNDNLGHHGFLENINCHGGINKCENCPDGILSRDPCDL